MADPDSGPGARRNDRDRDRIRALAEAWELAVKRLERRYKRVAYGVIGVSVLSLATLVLTVVLARHEAKQRESSQLRAITYRVCQRESVDRAYAHSFTPRRDWPRVERQLPILDCDPNITGAPAKPLSSQDQRAFVARFKAGTLPLREQGICRERVPDSPNEPVC